MRLSGIGFWTCNVRLVGATLPVPPSCRVKTAARSIGHDAGARAGSVASRAEHLHGEDCAEPHLHGSRAAVDGVADALAAASLRPAEPWGVHPSLSTTPWRRKPRRSRDIDGGGWIAGDRGWGLTRGEPAPQRDRPAPLALLDDDLDFYDHDHQHHRQEVKMSWLHLFLQVEAGGEIPPASSFAR
ncbi:MAG: GTP-binding protein TrmE N-terminus [Acetobacteraceae bacterium]|nr:GTP-binding protein TrmE N-terminus [Acetobacteraceae bacterium]